jgi:hypothetical protein
VIAVALGVAVLGEPSRMAIAAALVLAGVATVRAPAPSAGAHAREASDGQSTRRPLIRRTRNSTIAITSRT